MQYNILDKLKLNASSRVGVVTARCESLDLQEQYKIRYVNGVGDLVEDWYFLSAIEGKIVVEDWFSLSAIEGKVVDESIE